LLDLIFYNKKKKIVRIVRKLYKKILPFFFSLPFEKK
jgi:hypothetical protein